MSKKEPSAIRSFFFLASLALFIVGVLCSILISGELIWIAYAHFAGAVILLILFLLNGGVSSLKKNKISNYSFFFSFIYFVLIISVGLVGYNIVREHFNVIYDPTEFQAYSLSSDTKKIISDLKEEVNIRVFSVGGVVPKEISDVLDRYVRDSAKISWKAIDTDKNATLVEALGISEKDTLYINFKDKDDKGIKVSRVVNEETVTNGLRKLLQGKAVKLYAVTGHGEGDLWNKAEGGFLFFKEALEGEGYSIARITLSDLDKIDPKSACLLMMSPRNTILPLELDSLNHFLQSGGKLVSFLEQNTSADYISFLEEQGFRLPNSLIVGKEMLNFKEAQLGVQPIIDQYASHPAILNFKQSIILSTARPVLKKEMSDDVSELAFSAEESWAETNLEELVSKTPKAVKEASDILGPVSIAAVKDQINTKSRSLVIGDIDFVANINLRQLFNRDFALNLVNWTNGEDSTVVIRASTLRESQKVIPPNVFNVLFIALGIILPEAIILFGAYLWSKRH